MSDLLQYGQHVLASQPFSLHVGATLTALDQGRAELVIPIRQELKQQHGFVHGGVVSYAADNALTFAGGSALGSGRASVVAVGKRQAVCRCEVFVTQNGQEKVCAVAQGTVVMVDQG